MNKREKIVEKINIAIDGTRFYCGSLEDVLKQKEYLKKEFADAIMEMDKWVSVEEIELTKGQTAIVDAFNLKRLQDVSWQATLRSDGNGYYATSSKGRMHRIIMRAGPYDVVDHINGNGLDNRESNLRIGTQSQNCVNRKVTPGKYLRGTRPKRNKWQAYIKLNGKQRSLGYYDTMNEAYEAYLAEAYRLHGSWMPLPEPPKPKK